MEPKLGRRFLGKIDGFKDKKERLFEQKHLRAYLNGKAIFTYGRKKVGGIKQKQKHIVKQEYYLIDE